MWIIHFSQIEFYYYDWLPSCELWNSVIKMVCILDRIGSNRTDIKFTFHITAANGSSLEVGVKTEEDLKQWVEAIRTGASKPAVCIL